MTTNELLVRAWAAYHAGDFATARQSADEARDQADPATQGVGLTLRGLCEARVGTADDTLFAAAADRFAAAERPDGRRSVAAYGIALALSGRFAEAEPPLRRALMLELAGPDVWRCLGRVLAARDRTGARRTLAAAARAFPTDWLVALDRAELVTSDRTAVAEAWATAGALSFAAGRADVAVTAYTRAVDRTPKDLHLLLEKAKACAASGALDELGATMRRAIAVNADTVEFVPLVVQTADWALGQAPDTAIALLDKVIELEPEHARAHALLGSARRLLGDDTAAMAAYDRALAVDPDDAYALVNRGQALLGQGRHDEAVADLERASALEPGTGWIRLSTAEAYYLRAQADRDDADLDRAMAHADAALAISPGDPAVLRLIGYAHWLRSDGDPADAVEALRAARAANPDDPQLAYELGRLLYDTGAYEEALACAEQALAGMPDAPLVRLLRGQLFRAVGETERAVEDLTAAARAQPDLGEAHAALGEALRIEGRLAEAVTALTAAIELQPDDGWALASRGAARQALGDSAGALEDLRRAIGRGSEPSFAVWWLCEALRDTVDSDDLVTEIGAAAADYPDDPGVQEVYADALQDARRYAEAAATAERGLVARPDHVGLLRSLGWAQSALGEHARAVETLERAANVQPDTNTLTDLATIVARGDDVATALRTIDRALAVRRTSGLLRLRAEVFGGLADWPAAVEAARAAVAVEPVDPWAHWALGRALRYVDGGRPEEALAAFQAMREQEPGNPMGPQGTGDVRWAMGRLAEADADYRAAIELYEPFGEEESWTRHGIGWCLHRLGRYAEAADSYLLALPTSDERSALLFDIGLNWLAARESARAADAYAQGIAVLPATSPARAPATLAIAGDDLRSAVTAGVVADSAQVVELGERLAKERAAASDRSARTPA
ncbi:tetratricopeptide repeat protein [Asanoa hainanensis]|uniref:tetratricopeptide repeat protein n=1 Tax=Asanoa hainanensis TaxID=560556 RepID=UPI000B7903BD|nr:tetratricopeptide repeat protein [Asanoa hainanensis]